MGKSGDAIRAGKGQKTYIMTHDQLVASNRAAVEEYKKQSERQREIETKKAVDEYYADKLAEFQRQTHDYYEQLQKEFFSGDFENDFMAYVQYFFSICCRVMIEHFHWKPISKIRVTRTEKLACLLQDEINSIVYNEDMNLQTYAEETEKLYGLRFKKS
jgi:hypothetical protein